MLYQVSYWPLTFGEGLRAQPNTTNPQSQIPNPQLRSKDYFDSLCPVCFRQNRQNLLKASRSELFFRFLVVL